MTTKAPTLTELRRLAQKAWPDAGRMSIEEDHATTYSIRACTHCAQGFMAIYDVASRAIARRAMAAAMKEIAK